MAEVTAVCVSTRKGTVKVEKSAIELKDGWGIDGDAHAGDWHRQVSLLAQERIDEVRTIFPRLQNGAFAENIITHGIDLARLDVGDKLQIGESVVLEVTQIGKECHDSGCAIKKATGDCIMPREGIFTRVLAGGRVSAGDTITRL
jgi:MOSC domain-containing protein YiiM